MIEVRWHGRGGQGSFTIAKLLGMAASLYGKKYAQSFPSFGPERRGAPVLGYTRIDDVKITDRSEVNSCDYVVVLDETLWGKAVLSGLKASTVIVMNTDNPGKYQEDTTNKIVAIDATKLALKILHKPITNTAMLGALIAVGKFVTLANCQKAIKTGMHQKHIAKNLELIEEAYYMVKEDLCHE